jgi:hypothetical protein
MSINISDPINFIEDDSVDIGLNQTQINNYLTPIYDTAANPKITWENNKNTGMYHPQINTIAFSTNGTERLKLDATGNINFTGILTGDGSGLNQLNATNVRSGTLAVSQGGTGKNTLANNQILIGNGINPLIQTSYLTWDDSNNRLGIGITMPSAKLDVSHNTTETVFKVNQLGTGNLVDLQVTNTSILKIDGNKNINMNNNLIYTNASSNRVGIGTTEPSEKIHVIGNARIQGNLEVNGITTIINTNVANSEQLNITNDGTGPALTINQKGSADIIEIKDDDVTCLKIFDGGNLGIGTSTKIVTADISGNLNVSQTIKSTNVNTSSANVTTILNANMVDISNNSTNTALKVNQVGTGNLVDLQDNGTSKFKIDTNGNITASALYIDANNNNVGIGTIQPDTNTKLHVIGDTRIQGNLTVNGTLEQRNTNLSVTNTEQLIITNDGTGPAVIINQVGDQAIFEIQDDSAICFKIFNGGDVGIGTNTKTVTVDVSGNIKSSGSITSSSTISSTGNISSSAFVIASGSGVNASYGNTRIGNIANWSGAIHPTLGSSGATSIIMLDNPHITYKTDNIFVGRTFRAGIRCAANSLYNNYWDCGATGYGFEILNGTLNTSSTSCMTISNSGNVGIGITNPTNKFHIINSSTSLNADTGNISLYVYNPTNAANNNSIICNRIGGTTAGKAMLSFDVSTSHGWSIYTQGNDTTNKALRINSNWEGASGSDRLVIANNGVVTIGSLSGSTNEIKLQVYSSDSNGFAAIFKHPNDSQGIGIKFDGIQALGTNANQDLNLIARGTTGNLYLNTNASNRLTITGGGNVAIGAGFTSPYSLLHIKGTNPILTIMGQGGVGAKSQLNLSTHDTTSSNLSNCSLIATDNGNFGCTFQINLKTSGIITNAQFTPFYINSIGNIGISNTDPQNILQIGNAGRLRISNGNTDYTLIGTSDTDAVTNTKIVISGNGRVGNEGNVQYYSTNTGSHIWYTTDTNSERLRITSTGNVGLGVVNPQYKLDMLGDININGDIRINGVPYINSVLVTPSYFSLFDRIPGPSTLTSNYTFTSSNTFTVFRSGILHVSYSGDVKSVNVGLINATINIINTVSSEVIYTKVSSLLADQAAKNYSLPSILDNIGLTSGTYHATITLNTNTQIDNNNYQTLKVLFFPDNNVSNGLYSYNTKISYIFHKLNGAYNLPPDGTQVYSTAMNNILGNVAVSTGTTTINGYTIPKGYQIWTVGTTGTYTIIAGGASGAAYGSYAAGRGAVISTTYNLTAGNKIIIAIGQKPKNQSSGGGGTFVTKYNGTGAFTTSTQHNIILVAGGGGGAGSGILPGASNVLDYLPGLDASFATSGTRYNFKNSTYSSSTVAINGGGGGGNGLAGGNLLVPDGTDAVQTSSGAGGGGFTGIGGDVDSTCTGGSSFLNGGIPGQNTWGSNNTGAGFGGGGAGWYSGGGGGGYSGGQGAHYNEQTGGGGGGSYDINTATNNASPYTLWLATSSYPPSSYVTSGYNTGDGFVLIEYDNGQLLGPKSDTQTNPFYSWSEDIDTGMFRPAVNSIALTTNGSEKLRVDPLGNVGIGKTNPLYKLDISGNNGQDNVKMNGNLILSTDGPSNYVKCGGIMSNQNGTLANFTSVANIAGLCFDNNGSLALISNSAERMRIDNNGNIGIGINSISSKLHIAETTGTPAGANTGTIILDHNNSGGASSITFRSTVNRGSDYAYIQYQDSTSVGAGGESARLIIGTQNDADDHLILLPSGNVGINIMDPSYKLDVNGTFRATGGSKLTIQNGQDGGTGRGIMLWADTDTNWGMYMGQSGGSRSLSGGTACVGFNFTQHAIRFRVANSTTQGFIFENGSENCLFSIRGDGFSWLGGILNISDTQANTFGAKNNYMSTGSLIIGSIGKNFGGGNGWTSNTAGFLMECRDNTEIMIHDNEARLASFMYYTGANNTFTIGRNAGWGVSQVSIAGDISITNSCSLSTSAPTSFYWNGTTSLLGRASAIGNYSTSATVGDIILKSTNRLILQSGNGSYGVIIDTLNNVQMAGSITVSGSITASGTITGNGSGLNALNATNINTGILSISVGGTGKTSLTNTHILVGNGPNPILQTANLTWIDASNTLSATNFVGSGAGLTSLNVSKVSTGTLNVSYGGIGTGTLNPNQILIGNTTNPILQSPNLTWDNSLKTLSATNFVGSGTGLSGLNARNITTGTLSVIAGGTGTDTLPIGRLLIGNGTGALLQSGNLTWDNPNSILSATNFLGSGERLTSLNASSFNSGVVNVIYGGTGKTSLNANQILIGNATNPMIQSANLTWIDNTLSATNFVGSGTRLTALNASNINSGTLNVSYGGIGSSTLTPGQLLIGNGANPLLQSPYLSWNTTLNTLSATNFVGSGTGMTALNASNVNSGTLPVNRGGTGVSTSTGDGSVVLSNAATLTNGNFSGTGTGLSALNASNINSGTLSVNRGGTGVALATGNGSVVLSNAATMTNGNFSGIGSGLAELNALNVSVGTLPVARGGTGVSLSTGNGSVVLSNAATMTNGNFSGFGTGLKELNASNIISGTLSVACGGSGVSLSTGNGSLVLSNAATMTNGTFSGIGTGLKELNATNIKSGILSVAYGGTGVSLSTGSGSVVLNNGPTITNGTFSGTGAGLSALNASNINTGVLTVSCGGTGTSSSTGSGSLVLSTGATMSNGIFSGTGTGLTALSASNIDRGILNVAQGGTGLSTLTNNKLLIGNGSNSIIQSNNLHWNNTSNRLGINVTNPTSELDVSGNVTILGNVIPATNITYDLGSATNRWRDLYLSGNTININGLLLSKNNDGNLQLLDNLGNTKKLTLNELEFYDGTEKIVLTKNVDGKMILVRKDLLDNVLETLNISTSDLATISQLGIGISVAQLNAAMHILSTNNNNGLLLNHTNTSGNIMNIQKNGTTKLKIDNSGNLFASTALYVDTINNYVGICVPNPSYNLHVLGPARIEGDLKVNGDFIKVNTTIQNTDQLTITNNGTATTIIADQTGANSIVEFRSSGNTKFQIFSSGDVGIGKSTSNVNVDISGNLIVSGNMNASGSKLYNINATNINSGTLSVAYGGTGVTSSTGYGSVVLNTSPIITNGTFSGTGTGLTSLNGDNINTGKLAVLYGGTGVSTSTGSGSVVLNTNPVITNGTFSGTGSGLTSLNADNIINGKLSILCGGTGCTSLNSSYFDTTGNILSLKTSVLNTWTITGNNISYNNGNVAIGKANPSEVLDVAGNVISSGTVKGTGLITTTNLSFENVAGAAWKFDIVNSVLNFKNNIGGTFNNKLTLSNTGDLNVTGNISGVGSSLTSLNASNIDRGILNVAQGGTGVSNLSIDKLLVGNGINGIMQPSNLHWDSQNNRLGIGIVSPSTTLHVAGSITGTHIGSGTGLTALNASNISSGTLNVSFGGIGASTLIRGQLLIGNGIDALLQSSYLTWNDTSKTLTATKFVGSGAELTALNASSINSGILNVSCGGIGASSLTLGGLLIGNGTSALLQSPNLSWDTGSNTLSANNFVGSGTGLTALSSSNIGSGILNVRYGGTGLTTITSNKLLVGNDTNPILQPSELHWDRGNNRLGIGTSTPSATLDVSGNLFVLGNISGSGSSLTNLNSSNIDRGTLSISYGGTGVSSFVPNQILIGNGTNNLIQTSNLTWKNNSLGIGKQEPSEALDVLGNVTSSGTVKGSNGLITSKDLLFNNIVGAAWQMDISNYILNFKNDHGGTFNNKLTLTNTGNLNVIGTISGNGSGLTTLNATNIISGVLNVSYGGTGLTTITSNKLLVGNGTSQIIQPSNLHWDEDNNRLGICKNNPNSALDVLGDISVSGTFIGSGSTLTNLNTSYVSSGTLSALYGGTGCSSINTTHFDTLDNILKIKDSVVSKWTASGTSIYYNTGNIGIGITNPTGKLDISQNSTTVAFKVNQIGSGDLIDLQDNSISKFKIDTNGNITTSVLYLDAANNYIGIGTVQPNKQLHVKNESQFDNNMTINGDILHNKRLTITNSANGTALLINQTSAFPIMELQNNGSTTFKILDSGDVAIGTSTRSINVDISGNIKASNVIRSNLFYVGNESSTYGILRVYNNNNDNCMLFINDTARFDEGGSKTATLRNAGGALRLQSSSAKGLTIDDTGNVKCDTTITITGSGSHASWGEARIGNLVNWNNLSYPTIGSNGSSGSVIVIENPYIPYKTNDIFTNRTFRAGVRCAGDITYNTYWDCGATAYGFEILNSALNTGTSSCMTIKSNGNIGIGKTDPSATLDILGNINLSGTITGSGSGLNNLNASNINDGILNVRNGGTGLNSINAGCVLIGNGTNNLIQTNNLIWTNNCLGIGKTNPGTTLDVLGDITVSGTISGAGSGLSLLNASNISNGVLSASYGGTGCTTLNTLFFDTTDGVLSVKNKAFNPWEIIGTSLNYDVGNVGIGKIPSSTLDVLGDITASGNIIGNIDTSNIKSGTLSSTYGGTGCSSLDTTFFNTTGGVLSLKSGAASQWNNKASTNKIYYDAGYVGIGNSDPQFEMDVTGNINFSGSLYKNGSQYISSQWTTGTNNSDLYYNSGNVAIGKITPEAVLDISGNVLVKGSISATGDIVANYSDDRLKNRIGNINNSLEIINKLTAFKYTPNEKAIELGITNEDVNIGLSAQDVQKVLPEIVGISPLDTIEKDGKLISKTGENYLSIKYDRLVPILIENIKELQSIINQQSKQITSQDRRIVELEEKMTKILNYINV